MHSCMEQTQSRESNYRGLTDKNLFHLESIWHQKSKRNPLHKSEIGKYPRDRGLSKISINLLAFYHQRRSLIGYATHYLFCDR